MEVEEKGGGWSRLYPTEQLGLGFATLKFKFPESKPKSVFRYAKMSWTLGRADKTSSSGADG